MCKKIFLKKNETAMSECHFEFLYLQEDSHREKVTVNLSRFLYNEKTHHVSLSPHPFPSPLKNPCTKGKATRLYNKQMNLH